MACFLPLCPVHGAHCACVGHNGIFVPNAWDTMEQKSAPFKTGVIVFLK